MRVDVLVFGPQAASAGTRRLAVETPSGEPTAADVLAAIAAAAPSLAPTLPSSRLAVNHEFAAPERVVRPGDEVALVGMVSGG